jgi:hypothetical protein
VVQLALESLDIAVVAPDFSAAPAIIPMIQSERGFSADDERAGEHSA